MDMLGHDHISNHHQSISTANALQNVQEEIGAGLVAEEWLALVATEGEEMEIVAAVKAVKILGHSKRLESNGCFVCDM
jgi:hypothetical protein